MTTVCHPFCLIDIHARVTSPAITFHHTIPPGSKQADISFLGIPFDLALFHAHQSLLCSKWRIPHTQGLSYASNKQPTKEAFCLKGPAAKQTHIILASMTVLNSVI